MRNILNKIRLAIKSRLEYKGTLTEEQKERLSICEDCPFNSDNKEQLVLTDTLKMRINKVLNFLMGVSVDSDSMCTICGCNLIFKSSQNDPENMCPEGKWNKLKSK